MVAAARPLCLQRGYIMSETNPRLLVVSPAWVGDMVMAQTLYKLLKQRRPLMAIDVLAPPATLALVARMPEVDQAIEFNVGHGQLQWDYRKASARRLKSAGYEQAIVLPNSLKSALVPWLADIPLRTGFRGEYRFGLINDMRLLDKKRLPRMIDRFVALGVPVNAPQPQIVYPELSVDVANQAQLLAKLGLQQPGNILGLCPGAEFGDAKRWPAEHYARVAEMAIKQGMQVWIFGGPGDQAIARQITAAVAGHSAGQIWDLTGKTSLLDVIDLLPLCHLVLSNDSGLMHIAAAVGCPTAVVYGSTSPAFTPPLTDKVHTLSQPLPCSPCFKRTCPLGHKNCLNQLLPEQLSTIVSQYA